MMKLYWSPRTRSFTTLWLMEETGVPYERVLIDIHKGSQRTLEFLAVNPMGKVPALADGDATLAEAAAICAYVAERYPQAKLAPDLGDSHRAKYLYWLFFAPGCIEPAIAQANSPEPMQFERQGYFTRDPDSTADRPVFKRTIGLRDTFAKEVGGKG